MSQPPKIIAIVGPTAVGKSRLAMELGRELDAAIISADSRQVYRYMDIGTDKASLEERALVPHYMLDLIEPDDSYSAQRFQSEGGAVLIRLAAQNRIALVVGGTGFYIRALLDGLALPRVVPNHALRKRLRSEALAAGPSSLHARLALVDSVSAARIHANNLPRIIRALEIVEATGGPVKAVPGNAVNALYVGLRMERSKLRARADERIRRQVSGGLIEETRMLLDMGYEPEGTSLSGFGYRQMIEYLRAEISLERAVNDYAMATHRYIRRQITWFSADSRIEWFDAAGDYQEKVRRRALEWVHSDDERPVGEV
jgi:tRNA dimethylallyltransferase